MDLISNSGEKRIRGCDILISYSYKSLTIFFLTLVLYSLMKLSLELCPKSAWIKYNQ